LPQIGPHQWGLTVGQVALTEQEIEVVFGYLNDENDGIDLFPGPLDPSDLSRALAEIATLQSQGGTGEIGAGSARLAADVLAFFLDSYREMMQPWEAAAADSAIHKLRGVAGPN
jgi:hypothetical protein